MKSNQASIFTLIASLLIALSIIPMKLMAACDDPCDVECPELSLGEPIVGGLLLNGNSAPDEIVRDQCCENPPNVQDAEDWALYFGLAWTGSDTDLAISHVPDPPPTDPCACQPTKQIETRPSDAVYGEWNGTVDLTVPGTYWLCVKLFNISPERPPDLLPTDPWCKPTKKDGNQEYCLRVRVKARPVICNPPVEIEPFSTEMTWSFTINTGYPPYQISVLHQVSGTGYIDSSWTQVAQTRLGPCGGEITTVLNRSWKIGIEPNVSVAVAQALEVAIGVAVNLEEGADEEVTCPVPQGYGSVVGACYRRRYREWQREAACTFAGSVTISSPGVPPVAQAYQDYWTYNAHQFDNRCCYYPTAGGGL